MKEFSFPKKLVNLVEATLKYTEIKVKTANNATEPIRHQSNNGTKIRGCTFTRSQDRQRLVFKNNKISEIKCVPSPIYILAV